MGEALWAGGAVPTEGVALPFDDVTRPAQDMTLPTGGGSCSDHLWAEERAGSPAPDTATSAPDTGTSPLPDSVSSPPPGAAISLASSALTQVGRFASGALRGVRHAAGDPRLVGVLLAAPSVVSFISKSRERSAHASTDDSVVPVRTTPGLALQAYVDEILMAVLRHPNLLPKESDFTSAAADVTRLREMFAERGWLERPVAYHRDPSPPESVRTRRDHRSGMSYQHVMFSSDWSPEPGEPGRERWMDHEANRTVHTWVSRAPGRPSDTWLVCAHGLGMGTSPTVDLRAFRAGALARRGINVAVPVLPLHGPRASGRVHGEDFMTIDMVDSLHGVAHATWDMRRVIRWLRDQHGAQQVAVIGYSLGGLVASIVSSLESDLACVIAGIPVVDLPYLFRRHATPGIARMASAHGALGPEADDIHRVVSPLAMECRVPFDRRYVFAGLADRMSTFGQARRLWLHWGRPAFATYAGGHVGFYWSGAVKRFVDHALTQSLSTRTAA
jgi:pimeloyl-ACP methyl ester carboxylesterase